MLWDILQLQESADALSCCRRRLARFLVSHTNHHEVHSMSNNMIPLSDLLKSPISAMWRTLLNFLRLTYRLPRMQSHAQRLFGTSETVRGAQEYQSHWYHAGGREGMLMLPYGHSDRFRGHSFTQQTLTEDGSYIRLDIVKMWGPSWSTQSRGGDTKVHKIHNIIK